MTGAFRPDYYMNQLQLPFPTRTRLLSTKKADREVRSTGCGVNGETGARIPREYLPPAFGGDPDSGELGEFLVEREHEATGALLSDMRDRRVRKTQAGIPLASERLKCVRKEVGTRHKIQLIGVKQQPAHPRRHPQVAPYEQHRGHFQKDVFEQQPPAPLSLQETLHQGTRRVMVCVALVVEANQEARIENDHRRTP